LYLVLRRSFFYSRSILFSAPIVDLRPDFILHCLILSLCPCFDFCSPWQIQPSPTPVLSIRACPISSPSHIRELRVRLGLPALISWFGSCFSCHNLASGIWSCRRLGLCGHRSALLPESHFCSSLARIPRCWRCSIQRPSCHPYFPLL
jgi:hypothetical protein